MKQTKKIAQKKEAKKETKKIKDVTVNDDNEMVRLLKIILVLVVVVVVFFGITYLVTREKKKEDTKTEPTIQYDEILVGEIWNKEGTYFVLAGSEEDYFLSLYAYYLDLYEEKNSEMTYYMVNLDNAFNHKYFSDTSNLYTTNPSDIRFSTTTLLKVSGGRVVEAYEGKENIQTYLEEITK